MVHPHSQIIYRYGLALGCVAAVAVARYLLTIGGVGDEAPFLFFTLAILITAWAAGTGPGIAATLLSVLTIDIIFFAPVFRLSVLTPSDAAELVFFAAEGLLVAWLVGSRRRWFERLEELNANLEERVAARTAELQAANEHLLQQAAEREHDHQTLIRLNTRLQQSNRELQDFASVASHDLQEPLRKIQAFGDRLATRFGNRLEDGGKDYLDRMLKAAERMSVLINDLLAFSRVTSKAQPFVECDLSQIAHDVVSDLETRIEEVGGRVEVGELPTIFADPLQMRQLLQNLIGNGLKFRRSGHPALVRVYAQGPLPSEDETPGDVVQLHVADNGIGFDEKYLDRIFNVFQRLHGRMEYEGTGIGLAVCRKIARRHGGDITAHSRPGEGATFIVTLPVHPPGAEDASSSSGETHYDFIGR